MTRTTDSSAAARQPRRLPRGRHPFTGAASLLLALLTARLALAGQPEYGPLTASVSAALIDADPTDNLRTLTLRPLHQQWLTTIFR